MTDPWACPGATLILPADAERERWLEERRKGVGASDVAALFGEAAYGRTAYSLWLDKTGRVPDAEPSEAMEWGLRFEEAVAGRFEDETGIGVLKAGLMRSTVAPHAQASVDRLADDGGGLECKFQNQFALRDWGTDRDPLIPRQFYWQGAASMAVTGRPHWWFASVCGQRYVQRRLDRADCAREVDSVLDVIEAFWTEHVYPDVAPAAGAPDPELLTNPDLRVEASLPAQAWADLRRWDELAALTSKRGPLHAELAEIKDRMRTELGGAAVLTVRGIPIVRMQSRAGRRGTNYDKLQRDYPEAYANCVSPGRSSRFPIRIGKRDDDE